MTDESHPGSLPNTNVYSRPSLRPISTQAARPGTDKTRWACFLPFFAALTPLSGPSGYGRRSTHAVPVGDVNRSAFWSKSGEREREREKEAGTKRKKGSGKIRSR